MTYFDRLALISGATALSLLASMAPAIAQQGEPIRIGAAYP